ncbi:ABC transporter permease [Candidatus Micrarchaeota archaeon]|nr:ABC transporter permease [Candidatus Micrarchaeota archaeon]
MVLESFFLAARNLTHRRLRSLLTIIGIFIGIAAVVALVSIGAGLQIYMAGESEELGADKITVMATAGGMVTSPMASAISAKPLTEDDVDTVKRTPGVNLAGGMIIKSVQASFRGETKSTFLAGMPMDETKRMFENHYGNLEAGRSLKESDGKKVMIGNYFAREYFEKDVRLGDSIELEGSKLEVVGILKATGDRFDDSSVMTSMDVARDITGDKKLVSMVIAQVSEGVDMDDVRNKVEKRLRDKRGEKKGEETFNVQTSEQLAQSFSSIFGIVQGVIVGIAAISLLVGGVGIMNTMYTSVVERTGEIGIMKAVGAKNSDIRNVFLFEASLLGTIGGIVGIIIGAGLAKIAEIAIAQTVGSDMLKASFTPELIVGVLFFSFVVGATSGTLPAIQAASLKPVDALRYE